MSSKKEEHSNEEKLAVIPHVGDTKIIPAEEEPRPVETPAVSRRNLGPELTDNEPAIRFDESLERVLSDLPGINRDELYGSPLADALINAHLTTWKRFASADIDAVSCLMVPGRRGERRLQPYYQNLITSLNKMIFQEKMRNPETGQNPDLYDDINMSEFIMEEDRKKREAAVSNDEVPTRKTTNVNRTTNDVTSVEHRYKMWFKQQRDVKEYTLLTKDKNYKSWRLEFKGALEANQVDNFLDP